MAKFLLVIAVFFVVYLLLRNFQRRSKAAPPSQSAGRFGEDMVRCRVCGVHLPTSEAVEYGDLLRERGAAGGDAL